MRLKERKPPPTPLAPEKPRTQVLRSGILPIVRERLRAQSRCAVFDLGPPSSSKHMYLCHNRTRIYWNNMTGSFSHAFKDPGVDFSRISDDWIPGERDTHFDIVLAWNYFDYLDLNNVTSLLDSLCDHFVPDTWVYFLIHQSVTMPEDPPNIDLELDDCLSYRAPHPTREAPRHAPKVILDAMPGLDIKKLYLLSNGLQEHLFSFC